MKPQIPPRAPRAPRAGALALAAAALAAGTPVLAAPGAGKVTWGSAAISRSGAVTTITQDTPRVAIDWQSFGIAAGETVRFVQPAPSAVALNRVLGSESSLIAGLLRADGRVFILNPSGVLFTRDSRVQTAGLLAGTLGLSNADFAAGHLTLSGDSRAAVTNLGTLQAGPLGFVVLMADQVRNDGTIDAPQGGVALAAGRRVRLALQGDALAAVHIEAGVLGAAVAQGGAIVADGGRVWLDARSAGDLLDSRVSLGGVVRARTIGELRGRIVAFADGGTTVVTGTLDASAPAGGNGGTVETSGHRVQVAASARIDTRAVAGGAGQWVVDPDGFTVGPAGDIDGDTLARQLETGNVSLRSTAGSGRDGRLLVTEPVAWQASTTLSLMATADIDLQAPITAAGRTAGLVLEAGRDILIAAPVQLDGAAASFSMNHGGQALTGVVAAGTDYRIGHMSVTDDGAIAATGVAITLPGANARFTLNGKAVTLIHSMAELAALSPPVLDAQGHPVIDTDNGVEVYVPAKGRFAIAQNLDAAGTVYHGAVVNQLYGWLHGLGHQITGLKIRVPLAVAGRSAEQAALIGTLGQFGSPVSAAGLRDLRLVDADVRGTFAVAGLVASNAGAIAHVAVEGRLTGTYGVGGVAAANTGRMTDTHAEVAITALSAGNDVGGLVGENFGTVTRSSARGTIQASSIDLDTGGLQMSTNIGGLVGVNYGTIDAGRAAVDITAHNSWNVGGLVGENFAIDADRGVIIGSSASGSVTVDWQNTMLFGQSYGGLVGDNYGGRIESSSASGAVTVTANPSLDNSTVPAQYIGGLVGSNQVNFNGEGGVVSQSSASGNVQIVGVGWNVGGAIGLNSGGSVDGVRASGNVNGGTASTQVGGLVGFNWTGQVIDGAASGVVTGGFQVGGLVGSNTDGSITRSSSSGNVTGDLQVGGLVGINGDGGGSGTISDSSATGSVRGHKDTGGLAGLDFGSITGSSWRDLPAESAAAQAALDVLPSGVNPPRAMPSGPAAAREALLAGAIVIRAPAYSATVRRIEVDGEVFELEDEVPPAPAR